MRCYCLKQNNTKSFTCSFIYFFALTLLADRRGVQSVKILHQQSQKVLLWVETQPNLEESVEK